jgi:hypothetical protein
MASATGVRLIMKFNFAQQIRNAGWSESLDLGYADLPTANASLPNIQALLSNRCDCLGAGPLMVAATLIAYVQPPAAGQKPLRRNSLSLQVPTFPPPGNAYNKAFNPSKPFTADFAPTVYYINLQTNLAGTPVYRRSVWLAGLPDVADETDTPLIVDPATKAAVNKFMNDLQNGGTSLASKNSVSIRSVDRSGANPIKQCTAWNLVANTYTVPAHGFVVGQPIIAEGMKTVRGGTCPRGRYVVGTVVDGNTITLLNAVAPTNPENTGGFRPAILTFNTVAVATPEGFTKRDKGRPSGLLVGRRPRPATSRA